MIVCEGSKTEPSYFSDLRREEEVRLIEITIDNSGGVPKTLVERAAVRKRESEQDAKRQEDDNLKYDEVWCVFDVDEHPALRDAEQQARANGIHLAISNPCFELWFVLHFTDQNAYIDRRRAQSACRSHIKGYRKQMSYSALRDQYEDAVRRATELDRRHERNGERGANPSTHVYRLTERLRQLGRIEQLRSMKR